MVRDHQARGPIATMGDKALRYLEALQAQHPGLAPCVGQLADLYQRKLWHQASSPAPKIHLMSCSDGDVELFALFSMVVLVCRLC